MVFQNDILAGSSGASGTSTTVHTIGQSIRFNGVDTPQLTRTPSSSGNLDKWTFSCWVKRGKLGQSGGGGSHQLLLSAGNDVNNFTFFGFRDSGSLPSGGVAESLNLVASVSGSTIFELSTTQVFRDPSAWYNIVGVYDSGNSVSSERCRVYINGSRITEFNVETYPSQNQDSDVNESGVVQRVGALNLGTNKGHLDGYLAEIVLIDGTALDPSSFGEYNDSNIWIPKDVSGLTFGTNGFHIKGETASDLGNDSSGNNNDFTTSGLASHDQVSDSPSNNFCVANTLNKGAGVTLSEGNLKNTAANADEFYMSSTMGMNTGKWYMEGYLVSFTGGQTTLGITSDPAEDRRNDYWTGQQSHSWGYAGAGSGLVNGGSTVTGTWSTFTTGDIIGVAVDLDNNLLYLYKNGTVQNSGTGVAITDPASTVSGYYFFATGDGNNLYNGSWVYNWGQEGTFAGNTTAGGNSDGNGIGNFKYSVPSGYLALCTKNLGS